MRPPEYSGRGTVAQDVDTDLGQFEAREDGVPRSSGEVLIAERATQMGQ
jgi:hypothetical protein